MMRVLGVVRRGVVLASVVGILVVSSGQAGDWWPFGHKNEQSTAPVQIDEAPISAVTKQTTSFAAIVNAAAPSVVSVYSTRVVNRGQQFQHPFFRFFGDPYGFGQSPAPHREPGLGSGVIVTSDGYVLTNSHVVEDADELVVKLAGDRHEYPATLVGTDSKTDIAVIKIDGADFPAMTLTDSDNLEVGDAVLAIGNPFGVGQTVTRGIVSAIGRRDMQITDYENFIQTDASINPGNSGGALVDAEGRLVGINTAILSRSGGNQGIGFAVPVNLARKVMGQILMHGRPVRGYLGVRIQDLEPDTAVHFGVDGESGALVGEVTVDSAAAEAGMQRGDVITKFNGETIDDSRHLRLIVAGTAPGTKVPVEIMRDGKAMTLMATLKELPGNALATRGNPADDIKRSDVLRGVIVDDLDSAWRQRLNAPADLKGAVVTRIEPGAVATDSDLSPGDVIVEINRQRVASADQAIAISRTLDGDAVLLYIWSQGSGRYLVIKE